MYPVVFELGPLRITSYGLFLTLAFAAGIALARRRAAHFGLPDRPILGLCLLILASSLAGSKLLYVLEHPGVPLVGRAGLSMWGGVALALATSLIYSRLGRLPMLRACDALAPSVALGEGITRIGCFLNGCCAGQLCSLPWCVRFPGTAPDVHPTQLYASLWGFLVCALLLAGERRWKAPGVSLFGLLLLLGAGRWLLDGVRHYPEGAEPLHGPLVLLAATSGLIGIGLLARRAPP